MSCIHYATILLKVGSPAVRRARVYFAAMCTFDCIHVHVRIINTIEARVLRLHQRRWLHLCAARWPTFNACSRITFPSRPVQQPSALNKCYYIVEQQKPFFDSGNDDKNGKPQNWQTPHANSPFILIAMGFRSLMNIWCDHKFESNTQTQYRP